jgi:uncharacterized protein YndB with AHSA1/START domain
MSDKPLLPIVAETAIAAPIGRVWEILTSEETVPEWLGCMGYRREVGTIFHMQQDAARRAKGDPTGATQCEVLLLQAPHKFNFTWTAPGAPATQVQISLFSEGPDRTFVRLAHSGWEQFPADAVRPFYDQLKGGWTSAVLPGLKRVAEARR